MGFRIINQNYFVDNSTVALTSQEKLAFIYCLTQADYLGLVDISQKEFFTFCTGLDSAVLDSLVAKHAAITPVPLENHVWMNNFIKSQYHRFGLNSSPVPDNPIARTLGSKLWLQKQESPETYAIIIKQYPTLIELVDRAKPREIDKSSTLSDEYLPREGEESPKTSKTKGNSQKNGQFDGSLKAPPKMGQNRGKSGVQVSGTSSDPNGRFGSCNSLKESDLKDTTTKRARRQNEMMAPCHGMVGYFLILHSLNLKRYSILMSLGAPVEPPKLEEVIGRLGSKWDREQILAVYGRLQNAADPFTGKWRSMDGTEVHSPINYLDWLLRSGLAGPDVADFLRADANTAKGLLEEVEVEMASVLSRHEIVNPTRKGWARAEVTEKGVTEFYQDLSKAKRYLLEIANRKS